MNRRIKTTAVFFATYLGMLPAFFYLHAVKHEHNHHTETCKEVSLTSAELHEDICDLCDLYVKQHIFNTGNSFLGVYEQLTVEEAVYLFTASPIKETFQRLRAPPVRA